MSLELLQPTVEKEPMEGDSFVNSKYHYIATYILDACNLDDIEILHSEFITIQGDMDADLYYSECVLNETVDELWAVVHRPHWTTPPGIYRIVFGATCDGDKCWTDCGYEYDAWQNYTMLSKYRLTEKEIQMCWKGWANLEDVVEFK